MEVVKILRPITNEEARASYEALKASPCIDKLNLGRVGNVALDHFFLHHRLKAKTKKHVSFLDAMKSTKMRAHLVELVERYKKLDPKTLTRQELLRHQYSVFQLYYGTINQFRPVAAKFLYCKLKPTSILDFSAGWGGRCLAAMSMGIPYIGIDANTNLKPAYALMKKTLDPTANVQMFFQPSETFDFSKHTYDLVMTSPPYFRLEEYEKMPEYGSKQGFLDKFFIPVVTQAWAHLQRGGHLALNMPEEMYEAIRSHLPRLTRTYTLPVSNRNPVSAVKQVELKDAPRSELIYVWRKEQRKRYTRKRRPQ
jgi:hypothetical protein